MPVHKKKATHNTVSVRIKFKQLLPVLVLFLFNFNCSKCTTEKSDDNMTGIWQLIDNTSTGIVISPNTYFLQIASVTLREYALRDTCFSRTDYNYTIDADSIYTDSINASYEMSNDSLLIASSIYTRYAGIFPPEDWPAKICDDNVFVDCPVCDIVFPGHPDD